MRRLMLGMSQSDVADALRLSFQQFQKYEKGKNRIGASRLQQISNILQAPVTFFFEGSPVPPDMPPSGKSEAPMPDYISAFLVTPDGLALAKAFMKLEKSLRRSVVNLVEQITPEGEA
jgi:transcriptional regulator with XRE-family HTH domain